MNQTQQQPLLVIVGPTASGKSDLAVNLALRYNGEIISADSRQLYRHLNETTGKITEPEMRSVPHYMLNIIDPGEAYNAHQFADAAVTHVKTIRAKNKLPIIVGGSGFYIDALLFEGSTARVPADTTYRRKMERTDLQVLRKTLRKKDPDAYKRIDTQNPRRLIRALEVIRALGVFPMRQRTKRYEYCMVGLQHSRPSLRERIAKRLDARFNAMTQEIKTLLEQGVDPTWFDRMGLECRHIAAMLTKNIPPEETKGYLLTAIFSYAKRQETWLRRYPEAHWYHENQYDQLRNHLDAVYKRK